jgi:hypothetical protein
MTTLIFVTASDASPLIHLHGSEEEVAEFLTRRTRGGANYRNVGQAAALFLRSLSPDDWDEWWPATESTPIHNEESAWDAAETDYEAMIVWNITSWRETTPAQTPTTVEFPEPLNNNTGEDTD